MRVGAGSVLLGAVLSAVLLTASATPAAAAQPTARPTAQPTLPLLGGPAAPGQDGFYRPPDPLSGEPGDVIRHRRSQAYHDPARLIPVPARSWQVLYRSTDARGRTDAVSGTVLVPVLPWVGGGPRPIVSYAVGTHGLGDQCAPSYKLASGTEQELGLIQGALQLGWAVAVTDYQGLGTPGDHTYAVQRSEGRAVLDMARAAIRLPDAGLSSDAPVGLWGYSQGGGAAASAAEQAPDYARELNVVGVAAGGVPADLIAVARHVDGSPYFGLLIAAAVGFQAAYPDIGVTDLLTDHGREMVERARTECVELITVGNLGAQRLAELSTVDDPLGYRPLRERLAENRIGARAPEVPVRLYHAQGDQIIPFAIGRGLAAEYCRAGVRVSFEPLPVTEHLTGAAAGAPGTYTWLADRFAGRPAPTRCP
jgi:pimeloyl-ACP methyl ester carboxylesterase